MYVSLSLVCVTKSAFLLPIPLCKGAHQGQVDKNGSASPRITPQTLSQSHFSWTYVHLKHITSMAVLSRQQQNKFILHFLLACKQMAEG